jgi:tetratricopeptide (TPR) repeat protein
MRRSLFLSLGLAWLGGCSCPGKSATSTPNDAGIPAASQQQEMPTPVQELVHPPEGPVIPERAMELHTQGRAEADAGRYPEALKLFEQAQGLAPDWRLPLYDSANTYVLLGDNARALALHEQLEQLEPLGFAQSKKMLDSLRREKDGRVPQGTLREFLGVQQVRDPAEARGKLQELTKKAPSFVLAWQDLAMTAEDPAEGEKLLETALALNPDVETRGELLVRKGALLRRRGKEAEARALLEAVSVDRSLLPSARAQAREVLNSPEP